MKDISVILTVYNQSISDILFSLESLVAQQGSDFEIIIADDGSKIDRSKEIDEYFESVGFKNYKIARLKENAKTVGNILNAANFASGKYLKILGSGDCLYDERVLHDIVRFCEDNCVEIGFGKLLRFVTVDGKINVMKFNAPRNIKDYIGRNRDNRKILKHMLLTADWVPGGLQFGRADVLTRLWRKLHDDFKILYCEDFAATLALSESIEIKYFDRMIMWYDFSGGISTSGNLESVKRMYSDNRNLYKGLSESNDFGDSYILPRALFDIRQFVALHTPFYAFAQSLLSKTYDESDSQEDANEMLRRCISYKDSCVLV